MIHTSQLPDPVSPTFFESLATAPVRVLMTDYDGTLAPFRSERDQATPYPMVHRVLRHLVSTDHTRLIIISGRAVSDLKPLLALNPLPEIWGSHGWEHLQPDGHYQVFPIDPRMAEGLAEAKSWIEDMGLHTHCEVKPCSLAFHWRSLPEEAITAIRLTLTEKWRRLTSKWRLQLKEFDGGLEIRLPGRDKGTVVRKVTAESHPETVFAYLGDDMTDEDAFMALGDRGLNVLVRSEFRPTNASAWLQPPDQLLQFLNSWVTAAGVLG